jgi:hypothetical protein
MKVAVLDRMLSEDFDAVIAAHSFGSSVMRVTASKNLAFAYESVAFEFGIGGIASALASMTDSSMVHSRIG